ncbi:hypothetical protein LCGC14_2827520, partial [marine sediment metagenome]
MTDQKKADIFSYVLENIKTADVDTGKRIRTDMGDLAALATDLKEFGLHHPILVLDKTFLSDAEDLNGQPYLLLAGERRFRAALLNKWTEIPAKITQRRLSKWEISVIELHENLQRKNMSPLEEANSKAKIHTMYQEKYGEKRSGPGGEGHSLADTAKLLGESKSNVSMDLKIAQMANVIPELKDAKTKADARKMVKQFEHTLLQDEWARREQRKLALASDKLIKTEDARRSDLIKRYVIGDFFEQIKKVEERSIDLVELDPDWAIMLKEAVKDRGALTADGYT